MQLAFPSISPEWTNSISFHGFSHYQLDLDQQLIKLSGAGEGIFIVTFTIKCAYGGERFGGEKKAGRHFSSIHPTPLYFGSGSQWGRDPPPQKKASSIHKTGRMAKRRSVEVCKKHIYTLRWEENMVYAVTFLFLEGNEKYTETQILL